MRILIFNTFYYPKFVGGAEISVQILAEGLVNDGNEVYVVTFGLKDEVERINDVIIFRIKQRNIYSSYKKGEHSILSKTLWHLTDANNVFYHTRIKNILKRVKPDLVHTNNIQGFSPYIWAIIKSQNIPLIHTIRDYYLLCHQCNLYRKERVCTTRCTDCWFTSSVKSNFMKYPDLFVGISSYILNEHRYIIDQSQQKAVIYNGAAGQRYETVKQTREKLTFGYMGRISKDKGIEYLINEFQSLPAEARSNLKIVVAGNGDVAYVNYIKQLSAGLDIDFAGHIHPTTLYSFIDVLIVPSLWPEPFGRIVIESFASDVPVCIAASGGLTELHNENCSWLFKPEKGELRRLITFLTKHPDAISAKKSHCLDQAANFSIANYIKSHLAIYHGMLFDQKLKQA